MEYEHQLSKLIYDYLLNRFKFGYYQYGDSLPTVDVFCSQFNVSVQTIWAALRRLRTDGYIDMKNGRITRVVYKQTEQERRDFIIEYFSQRWLAYLDIYRATELMYIPFWIEGFRRMDEQDIAYIALLAERADVDDNILFYSFTLQKVDNPLLMNLFWETSLFLGYPFAKCGFRPYEYNTEIGRKQLRMLVRFIQEGSWESIRETLIQHQRSIIDRLIVNMQPQIRTVPKDEQIPFIWRIYNGHPQVSYDLVYRLFHEMYMGEYRKTGFLPSYEKMAVKYGVSVSTVRRTVRMTNQIGATASINGKGIRIVAVGENQNQPDFSSPVIRRNLSYLIQSLELIFYTCEAVSYHFFQHLQPGEREELILRFEDNQRSGHCKFSIHTYLYYIAKYSRIQAIKQIYSKIYGLFLWGYPLRVSSDAEEKMTQRGEEFTDSMIRYMRQNDVKQCVTVIQEYIKEQQPYGKKYLEEHGVSEEELRLSPCIRLLISDE